MVWVRVDDEAMTHPKQMQAGLAACGLWLAGLCYSNKHATDGKIPTDLRLVCPRENLKTLNALARRLVESGLWVTNETAADPSEDVCFDYSFAIKNYSLFQNPALRSKQILKRDEERQRKSKYREKTKHVPLGQARDTSSVPSMSPPPVPDPDPVPKKQITNSETATGDAHRWRGLAMRFFRDAYEHKRNDAWQQGGYFGPDFDRICRACKTESDIETGIKNFFAMADSYVVQEDYSPRILAKNWNKYRNPPKPSVVSARPLADDSRWHESNRAAWVYDRFDQPPPGCDSARLWWEHHENKRIREAS